jgi:hypothetical protein
VALIVNTDASRAHSTSRGAAHPMGCRPEALPRVVEPVARGASLPVYEAARAVVGGDLPTRPEVALSMPDDSLVLHIRGAS